MNSMNNLFTLKNFINGFTPKEFVIFWLLPLKNFTILTYNLNIFFYFSTRELINY